jgi:hypothetical protein
MKSLSLKLTRSHLVQVLAIIAGLFAVGLWQPSAAADGTRVVKYGKEEIVPVHAKLRFSTLIVLPEEEEIIDFTTATRNSGSSMARTTSATCTRPRPASAAI